MNKDKKKRKKKERKITWRGLKREERKVLYGEI
jgi:hypothetical protein